MKSKSNMYETSTNSSGGPYQILTKRKIINSLLCFLLYMDLNKFVNVAIIQFMLTDFRLSYKAMNWSVPGQICTSSGCPGHNVGESNAVFHKFVVVVGIQLFRY